MTTPSEEYRLIPLTQGKFAKVDPEDFPILSGYKWHFNRSGKHEYGHAARWASGRELILMHREILGLKKGDKRIGDHRFHDTLDNRKVINGTPNLRICDHAESARNRRTPTQNTSGMKGISWDSVNNAYRVVVGHRGKIIHVGRFTHLGVAKMAHDTALAIYHGGFACFD